MPGKARVHELAKELDVTSQQVLATLAALGEFVKSASSTIEAPAADRIRHRYANAHNPLGVHPPVTARRPRQYPTNNPYSDLGQDPYPHDRAVERRPPTARGYDHLRRRRPGDAPPPPPPVVPISSRPRRPRREWWRGDAPGDLTRYLLDEMIVPRRDDRTTTPPEHFRYFEDEVKEARECSSRWAPCLLQGMDYDEIVDWIRTLDERTWGRLLAGALDDPADVAIRLAAGGVNPGEMGWHYEDRGAGTLADRLRHGQMTVDEVIVEAEARRSLS